MEKDLVQSIIRAVKVLECFTEERPSLGLTEISTSTGMKPPTVRRLLKSLKVGDFIEQDTISKKYRLGHGIIRLNSVAMQNVNVRNIANPHLKVLSQECEENVYLAINSGNKALYIDVVESKQEIVLTGSIGSTRPLHNTGTGIVLLAFLSDDRFEEMLTKEFKDFKTDYIKDLKQRLVSIRNEGIAVLKSEYNSDVFSVAAPIFDNNNEVIASIAISGPVYRLNEKTEFFKEVILKYSHKISIEMGSSKF